MHFYHCALQHHSEFLSVGFQSCESIVVTDKTHCNVVEVRVTKIKHVRSPVVTKNFKRQIRLTLEATKIQKYKNSCYFSIIY